MKVAFLAHGTRGDIQPALQSGEAREILAKGRISTLVRRVTADESIAKAVVETTTDADLIESQAL